MSLFPNADSTVWSQGWSLQSVAAWWGLRGCHVGSLPPLRLISGVHRDLGEAYQGSCCLITFFYSSLPPLNISGCHSLLRSVPKPSFIYLSLFQSCFAFSTLIFLDLWGKGPRWHQRRGCKNGNARAQTAHSRSHGPESHWETISTVMLEFFALFDLICTIPSFSCRKIQIAALKIIITLSCIPTSVALIVMKH